MKKGVILKNHSLICLASSTKLVLSIYTVVALNSDTHVAGTALDLCGTGNMDVDSMTKILVYLFTLAIWHVSR